MNKISTYFSRLFFNDMHVIETDAIKRRYSNFANRFLYIILYILFLILSFSLLLKSYIRKRSGYRNFFFNRIFIYFYTKSIVCNMQYIVEFHQKIYFKKQYFKNSIFLFIKIFYIKKIIRARNNNERYIKFILIISFKI